MPWSGVSARGGEDVTGPRRCIGERPFNVNLFAGGVEDATGPPSAMMEVLAPDHAELGLPAPLRRGRRPVPAQLEAVLEARPPIFSFTFGIPGPSALAALKDRGTKILGTATTVEEARRLEAAGVDVVVAQGYNTVRPHSSLGTRHRGSSVWPVTRREALTNIRML